MQMEWMRTRDKSTRKVNLDGLVPFDDEDATLRKELLSSMSSTHELK